MKIDVVRDSSRREIAFEIKEGEVADLDVTESWHRRPRVIRPASATLVVVDGEARWIRVHGWLVLKNGKASTEISDKREWRSTSRASLDKDRIENAPEWVRMLWQQAPRGVATWSWDTFGDLLLLAE